MSNLLDQFRGEQAADGIQHPAKMTWPGANGLPFAGPVPPLLKQHEIEALPVQTNFHCREFNLGIPADKIAYESVMNRICAKWFIRVRDMPPYRDPETGHIKIYLEWIQRYSTAPQTGR